MQACYDNDWERRGFKVCGQLLAPLTLDHARVLYLSRSPFVVVGGSQADASDLLMAVAICSTPKPPARDQLATLVRPAFDAAGCDINSEAANFASYLRYYTASPIRFLPTDAHAKMPWPWAHYCTLRRRYGYSDEDAWGELCIRAFWMTAAASISDGDSTYPPLEEAEAAEMIKDS